MDMKPIRTEEDYQAALQEIDAIFDAQPGTPQGDRLEILVILVDEYEEKNFPIPLPDPIEAIKFHMERLGLDRKDLEPYIGNRARVSEVLNRKRPLSLRMIRNLSKGLGISPEILVQDYSSEPETGQETNDLYRTQSVVASEENNYTRIVMNLGAGNWVGPSISNWLTSQQSTIPKDTSNTTSRQDCFYVERNPIRISNWPVYSGKTCETEQPNQSGTSRF